ncbi:MAG: EamA family transporter [Labilithrix sp.]|nr:EamA family transporter [Labilithrix sp.]MCW5810993.1 EamA family transporter [Labilithrix sp.]
MKAKALALVLASAFIHASWNAILKRCREPEHAVIAGSVVSASFAVVIGALLGFAPGRGYALGWALVAGLLEAAYFQALGRALARGTLGTVYTVSRGGALLVVWPISVLLLGEELTPFRAGGTMLVIAGLAGVGFSSSRATAGPASSGFAIAALTGLFIGGYNLAYKRALAGGVSAATSNAVSLGLAAAINVALVGRARRTAALAALRGSPLAIGLAGFLGATGFLLFLAALAEVGAGLVVTLRNTSILFAQGMGFFLGERPGRLALAGTAAVTAGAILLAL